MGIERFDSVNKDTYCKQTHHIHIEKCGSTEIPRLPPKKYLDLWELLPPLLPSPISFYNSLRVTNLVYSETKRSIKVMPRIAEKGLGLF